MLYFKFHFLDCNKKTGFILSDMQDCASIYVCYGSKANRAIRQTDLPQTFGRTIRLIGSTSILPIGSTKFLGAQNKAERERERESSVASGHCFQREMSL